MLKLNCGLSYPEQSFEDEMKKIHLANKFGVEYVSVISVDATRANRFWQAVEEMPNKKFTICSAPIYENVLFSETIEETIKRQTSFGVGAMTIHITPISLLMEAEKNGYIINSRGGEFLREVAVKNSSYENPFYSRFDEMIDFSMKCGVKEFFLGTALRPGACEKLSKWTLEELKIASVFYDRLTARGIPAQIEGFGHVIYDEWSRYKMVVGDRPMSSMGPLLTDCVNGFDEINAIMGYTLAVYNGFNIKTECMLSRKEHIDMPTVEDVEDEIQKWKVAETTVGIVMKNRAALEAESKVIAVKDKQRTQCSGHVNIFGTMNVREDCRMCGVDSEGNDRCPLRRNKIAEQVA